MRFDTELLADKTVDLLGLSAGQVIWIWASTHSLDLIEALAFRIRERGAFWTLRLTIEPLLRRIGRNIPEPYLGLVPDHELRWLDDIDAIVGVHDHGGIVWDEIAGQMIACIPLFFLPPQLTLVSGLGMAFVLFRLFDIAKPWPIRWADRKLGGGFGIMFDDVLAGIAAAGVLVIFLRLIG